MVLKIFLVIAALIVAVLIFAATRPNSFQVERSITINASPERIFSLVNDLRAWERWAPEDRKDPAMKTTFSDPASGTGASSDWDSTGRGGKGRMQIVESISPSKVSVKVDFVRPFEAHNLNQLSLVPDGSQTRVTWSINASQLYAMKLMGIFMSMEGVFGTHIQSGLNNLKALAEKQP